MSHRIVLHIDFNSYFATIEQQANPRLRGKPIGVTGGDRLERTVLGAVSIEAKAKGVKGGMTFWEARKYCPDIILVRGDSDKYLSTTKKFIYILKDFSPFLEVFSIDECFMELPPQYVQWETAIHIAETIKQRIHKGVGEWVRCSIGISYNKVMAKLAGSIQKPDGLIAITDPEAAMWILDRRKIDDICGIGSRIKKRLNNMGVFDFATLRKVPRKNLVASFKSYGNFLYDIARGENEAPITPFYEKEEVKSVGHRHTIDHDTADPVEIKQILLKLTELIGRKLRSKKLIGRTVSCWYRAAFDSEYYESTGHKFYGEGMQITIAPTQDGLEIFTAAWKIFEKLWDRKQIRMIGVSISNLTAQDPHTQTLLEDKIRQEKILKTLDKINDEFGEFTLQRGILLQSAKVRRKPNPYLADYRFKL